MPEELKEVEVSIVERWGWECPECGQFNEEDFNPTCFTEVTCEECSKDFKPVEG